MSIIAKKFKSVLPAIVGLMVASCGTQETEAEKAVLSVLKDPDSAKFGKYTRIDERSACITINAKNAMGGYTGDQQASLVKYKDSESWDVLSISEGSHETCIKILSEVMKTSPH